MSEIKKPLYTANGLLVDGDSVHNGNVEINKKLSFGADGKLVLLRHANATGIQDECRVNSNTGDLEVFDDGNWANAFTGGLKWTPSESQFTIKRRTDDKNLTVPHIDDTTSILQNVPYYQAEQSGNSSKPSYGRSGSTHAGDGMYFINDGVAFSGAGQTLIESDTTSFRVKFNGSNKLVVNANGVVSKVSVVLEDTLQVDEETTFKKGVVVETGDLDISSGRLLSGGNVVGFSDERIKSKFQRIENALKRILSMEGGIYHNLVTGGKETGLKAQQVRSAISEAVVATGKDVTLLNGDEIENVLAVAYGNLAGLWVEGFREIDDRLAKLEALCLKELDR
ncbi:intramolecular chaperone auto-processing domain protein [Vibrio phage 1.244.A._10N.261.54.C3]|nr:intramolecular chaperone auto-processing domain protein [Vibrio phage 1.244.A._10N.261.54.C3]AUR98832.1 intramolecular chaperone auto-processing domain protein [Vibrio phage 1.255.O._10N.286.45.F1]